MAPKRSHKTLTLGEKQEILNDLKSGVSGKSLAEKYGVGTSTISDIKTNRDKIMGYVCSLSVTVHPILTAIKSSRYLAKCISTPKRKRTLRNPEYAEMEAELYKWFLSQRERHANVTTNILREKALQIYAKHSNDNKFIASKGWIARFKERYGIRQLKVSGEKLSSDSTAVMPFLQKFAEKMNELSLLPSQVYNADESALFWKLLPDHTLVHVKETSAPGRKTSKERVTFLICANGDGSHKLKMMVIGKAKNPRAFKDIYIPVEYHSTKNAWMTSALFVQWFHESFVKQVRKFQKDNNLNGKALLLIDNAPSHASEAQLTSNDGEIVTMFLPPNCTPLLQPMDQNAIRLTKLYYRKSLLVHILAVEDDISNALKSINLKDAVFLLSSSWEKVQSDVIKKCWKKIFSYSTEDNSAATNQESEDDSDDDLPLDTVKERLLSVNDNQQNFTEINSLLQQISSDDHQFTESELTKWIAGDDKLLPLHSDDSVSDEEIVMNNPKVKHEEAISSFNTCIRWAEENGAELATLSTLRMMRERAIEAKQLKSRQAKITDFF